MPSYEWQHNDPRGMSAAIVAALARCSNPKGDLWKPETPGELLRADLRALLVATMYTIDSFSMVAPGPASVVEGAPALLVLGERAKAMFSSDERVKLASTLLETWRTIVVATEKRNEPVVQTPSQFSTDGGGVAQPLVGGTKDAGFGWPVAAVAIVGVTIQAGVICYVADKVAVVIDNELTRREATRQMVAVHGRVMEILAAHRALEEKAGAAQPLTEAEKASIKALGAAQIEAQKSIKLDVPSLFPNLKDKGGKLIDAATSLGWGALAIAGLLAYAFFAKGK